MAMALPADVSLPARSHKLGLYAFLSRGKGPRSYIGKILLVAFLGTHIPLLALLAHFIITNSLSAGATSRALLVALIATLAGTGLTLLFLTQLLSPILLTRRGLQHYLDTNTIPNLPTHFSDDAGILMTDTQRAIEKLDEIIVHLAHYDALTALPNKTLFEERVKQAVAHAAGQNENKPLAVLVLDMEGLKSINDLYGPVIGDRFLKAFVARMQQTLGECDTLARIGGDEFAVLQTGVCSVDDVIEQARRLSEAAQTEPIRIDDLTIRANVSLGVALYSPDDVRAAHLLRDAEAAMYQSKQLGTGHCQFYSPEMNEQMRLLLACDKDLRCALEQNEFVLHYQPQIDLESGAITGVEALLRWNHSERGLVPPGEFIPVAEQNGLIVPIGEWVLKTACQQNKAWQNDGLPPVRIAVNLSARQFHHPNLVECVAQILEETGLDPRWLELEITESLAIGNEKETIAILNRLRDMGIALSLDDFGTGYSSLSQLKRFPLHTLKIDRAFLQDVLQNTDNAAIVSGIIGLAHNLRLNVIAEGVETVEQVGFLRANGCETLQGFLFSRPVPAEQVAALLEAGAFHAIK